MEISFNVGKSFSHFQVISCAAMEERARWWSKVLRVVKRTIAVRRLIAAWVEGKKQ